MKTPQAATFLSAALLVAGMLLGEARPAAAFSNSIYSVPVEDAYPNQTTGIYAYNAYPQLALSGSGCAIRYYEGSSPVVFSHWVMGDAGLSSQVEIGVEQQCGGYTFLFWGWRTSSAGWQELGHIDITADVNGHYFDIHRLANVWYFLYDGVQEVALSWTLTGSRAAAGLESASTASSVPAAWFSLLQLTVNEGPWTNFANNTWIINAPMCGAWVTPYTRWSAAENNPC